MDPVGQFVGRFPLVARARPACIPLTQRVADLCERARMAKRDCNLAAASAVHNLAALLASDCGLPHLARQWCHHQANLYLRAHPLDAQAARHALEPLINLARLEIRHGDGERAFHLIDALYSAVSTRADATIDGIEIPADLTNSAEAHKEVRHWLWAVLLATSARALAVAGRWEEALAHLRDYKGIGRRMLDGRQIAVLAHAVARDTYGALALLDNTEPGQPWENAVTACLAAFCHHDPSNADLDTLLNRYHALDTSTPGLTVFHTRLGLAIVDAISTVKKPQAHPIAIELISRATASQDGYAAYDLLAHADCRDLLTETQTRKLMALVETCALGRGTLPATLLTDLKTALTSAEEVIAGTDRPRRRHGVFDVRPWHASFRS